MGVVMSNINYDRGLSNIPIFVEKAIGPSLVKVLRLDGHGISFPDRSGCQMRIFVQGVDLGGFYSYKICGGIKQAIELAMSRNWQLRVKRKEADWQNTKHVSFTQRIDKRNGKTEFRYSVGFRRNGKPATKSFFIGYDNVTADQVFHTYRTAMIFKWYLVNYGESKLALIFINWRKVRVYDGFKEFDWSNRL